MSSENLVRYTCDNCGKVEEIPERPYKMRGYPDGWITVSGDNHRWTHSYCSVECAKQFRV